MNNTNTPVQEPNSGHFDVGFHPGSTPLANSTGAEERGSFPEPNLEANHGAWTAANAATNLRGNGTLSIEPARPSSAAVHAATTVTGLEKPRLDWMHDLVAKQGDGRGNTTPRSYAYDAPAVEDVPLESTPWARLVAVVGRCNQALAEDLHAFYDHKLRPTIRILLEVRCRAEEALEWRNRAAREHNRCLDAKIEELRAKLSEAAQAHESMRRELDQQLALAHDDARHKVALTGGFYDPQNPDPACVLRHQPARLEALAGEMGLPWTPDDDKARLPKVVANALTVGIGMITGVSLGLMTHFYTADTVMRRWPMAVAFAIVGLLIALAFAECLRLGFRAASERYWLGRPLSNWGPILALELLGAMVIVLMDAYIQQQGLMALANLESAMESLSAGRPSHGVSHVGFFLAGMILSLPYVAMNAWHGYLMGRHHACYNRLVNERDRRFATRDHEVRQELEVQQALAAVSKVLEMIREQRALQASIDPTRGEVQQEIAKLEAQRLNEYADFDEETKARIHDAANNYRGAQKEWDLLLEKAKKYWAPTDLSATPEMHARHTLNSNDGLNNAGNNVNNHGH